MNPWYAKIAVLITLLSFILIRWPHGKRSMTSKIAENRKGRLEVFLLLIAAITTTFLPMIWLVSGVFHFAEYPLHPVPYGAGVVLAIWGLWLFHRSHVDLGTNWSVTLQVREEHKLITRGVYKRIRHPMYTSMFLLGIAQALMLPNWLVGPAYFWGFGLLYLFRIGREEQMMVDKFGAEYEAYRKQSGRLLPRLG